VSGGAKVQAAPICLVPTFKPDKAGVCDCGDVGTSHLWRCGWCYALDAIDPQGLPVRVCNCKAAALSFLTCSKGFRGRLARSLAALRPAELKILRERFGEASR